MTREVVDEGQGRIEVWAKTTKFEARRRYEVERGHAAPPIDAVAQLAEAAASIKEVVDRHRAEDLHLLAHGKRWSFDEVLACQDGILETHDRLSLLIDTTRDGNGPNEGLLWGALTDAARAEDGEFAYVEAGIEIDALMKALDARDLSMTSAGSSSGQSLAGLFNTGSHGSEFDMPPLPDMVRAVAMVCADGVVRWIEPDTRLTRAGGPAALLPGATVLASDDAFSAALVTVGSLGVIVAYVIDVRRAYGLWETVEETNWRAYRAALEDRGAFFEAPDPWWRGQPLDPAATYRAGEVLINPFRDPHTHERRVHIVRRAERDAITPELHDWERADWRERASNRWTSFKALVATISEDADDYGPVVDDLLRTGREETEGFAPAHRVLNFGRKRLERVWSVDVVLPTAGDVHLTFMDEVFAAFDALIARNLKMAGFLALRFSKRTEASLGMQNDAGDDPDARFAQLELFLLQAPFDLAHFDLWREKKLVQDGVQFFEAFRDLAATFHARGELRFHWGQLVRRLAAFAPHDDADLERWHRGRKLLVGDAPYLFCNALMMEAKVVPPPEGFELDGVLPRGDGDKLAGMHRRAVQNAPPSVSIDEPDRVYAVDGHGRVSRRDAEGRWRALRPRDGVDAEECPAGRLVAGARRDGRACVIAIDEDNQLRCTLEEKAGKWSDWERVDRERVGDPALVKTAQGLEIFAASQSGLEHFREKGDDGWEQLPMVVGSAGVVDRVAAARLGAATLVLAHRSDETLRIHRIGAAGWKDAGGSSPREPALLSLGGRALGVWVQDDRLVARLFDEQGDPVGAAVRTAGQPGLSRSSGLHLSKQGAQVRVALADAERRGCVYTFEEAGGWVAERRFDALRALGGPTLVGDELLVKVAHDIVVRCSLT